MQLSNFRNNLVGSEGQKLLCEYIESLKIMSERQLTLFPEKKLNAFLKSSGQSFQTLYKQWLTCSYAERQFNKPTWIATLCVLFSAFPSFPFGAPLLLTPLSLSPIAGSVLLSHFWGPSLTCTFLALCPPCPTERVLCWCLFCRCCCCCCCEGVFGCFCFWWCCLRVCSSPLWLVKVTFAAPSLAGSALRWLNE